jgi:hypothetical protein
MTSDWDDGDDGRAAALRSAMVAELRDTGSIHCERVLDAFRVVPRHRFVPDVPLEDVYAMAEAVVTKRNERGVAVSSVSAPSIQAAMLVQADIRPGMNVLEIGSGGCNAALLAELVGPEGAVTSVDIDAEGPSGPERFCGLPGTRGSRSCWPTPSSACRSALRTTGSSSRSGPGTCRQRGWTSSSTADGWSSRCKCVDCPDPWRWISSGATW